MAIVGIAVVILVFAYLIGLATPAQRARYWGGNQLINLPPGEKLVNATWKGNTASLWILTAPMPSDYAPTNYTFREYSALTLIEGTVLIRESSLK